MARVEINNGGHQIIVDDPNGQRADVAREARKLWERTRIKPAGPIGFGSNKTGNAAEVA